MTLLAGRDVTGRDVLNGDVVAWFRSEHQGGIVIGEVESFTDAGSVRIRVIEAYSPAGPTVLRGELHTASRKRVVRLALRDSEDQERLLESIREADDPNGT